MYVFNKSMLMPYEGHKIFNFKLKLKRMLRSYFEITFPRFPGFFVKESFKMIKLFIRPFCITLRCGIDYRNLIHR